MDKPLRIEKFSKYYYHKMPGDYNFNGHSHSAWEINVVLSGRLSVTYNDNVVSLEKNMLVIFENNTFHRNRVLSPEGTEFLVFMFYIDNIPKTSEPRVYSLNEDNLALVKLIREEAEKNAEPYIEASLRSMNLNYQSEKLLEVLLMRLLEEKGTVITETHPDEIIYKKAVSFMKSNISRNITIDEVGKHCHISPTKLKNTFLKYAGTGVITHFSNLKINEAMLLLNDGMSVGEVSDRLSYSSQAYFSLCFKKHTGMSPLSYKLKRR